MANDLLPNIPLTPIETKILEYASLGKTPKHIGVSLGIPTSTVTRFLAKKEVKEVIDTMVEARNKALLNYLPNLLMDIIDSKIERVQQDPELSMADASKKDIVEIAKTISDIIKGSSSTEKQEGSGVVNFYQTLGFVAQQDAPKTIDFKDN